MTTSDPVWATVAELSRAFQARTLSPVDAVDALLARIGPPTVIPLDPNMIPEAS